MHLHLEISFFCLSCMWLVFFLPSFIFWKFFLKKLLNFARKIIFALQGNKCTKETRFQYPLHTLLLHLSGYSFGRRYLVWSSLKAWNWQSTCGVDFYISTFYLYLYLLYKLYCVFFPYKWLKRYWAFFSYEMTKKIKFI